MSKTEADNLLSIDLSYIKQQGYLKGIMSGTLSWTSGFSDSKSSVSFTANIFDDFPYFSLSYQQTDRWSGEKKSFNYKVRLESTPCNLGGERWWFICPLVINGRSCERRVRKLYKDGDHFGCRHCYDLTYESRNKNRSYKWSGLFKVLETEQKIEELQASIKRRTYAGRLTKKQLRLYKLYEMASGAYNKADLGKLL
ncbi:MAG: hypothetical protein ABSD10_02870 [Candidatus Saccharimonadales bacterium]|jgi:hypothetical protein